MTAHNLTLTVLSEVPDSIPSTHRVANYELLLHFPGDPNALLAPAGTTCMWCMDVHVGKIVIHVK